MLKAYNLELGGAFPSASPESVLQVLRECNKPEAISRKTVEKVTELGQSTVSKLVAKMIDREWLEEYKPDPATSVRPIQISLKGQGVLIDLEKACRHAARNVPKTKGLTS
jgi:DNA-binding MarR family transcriptional regulator